MRLCKVKGNSMHPFLRDEDLVLVKKVPVIYLKAGNILVFEGKDRELFIHRLVGKYKDELLYLQGDGYDLLKETVPYDAVEGKVIGILRNHRFIQFSRTRECYYWALARLREFFKNLIRGKIKILRSTLTD